eukprot:TRINITY_DN9862_c0_g1_i2.p1 TRINITY_DN9862_c0_g1~~TRINITY_DN9862_c0_g1_i2.p1  ORF type:complete len:282 (+),score=24.65 TRINITY_DN9862_c0_g1_i2:63-908(+)
MDHLQDLDLHKSRRLNYIHFPISSVKEAPRKDPVHIKIPDFQRLREKIERIRQDGIRNLEVISDFDHTMTPLYYDGAKCPATFGIFASSPLVRSEYKIADDKLFSIYFPIEQDANLPLSEKVAAMEQWWEKALSLIINEGYTKEDIAKIIESTTICLRYGVHDLRSKLKSLGIPLYIISGGLGDVITSLLVEPTSKDDEPDFHIISNYFELNDKGVISSIRRPVIHSMNKVQVLGKSVDSDARRNAIIIGDQKHDFHLADNLGASEVLTFLFANTKVNLLT